MSTNKRRVAAAQAALREAMHETDAAIMATPTGAAREALTEANIYLMRARDAMLYAAERIEKGD